MIINVQNNRLLIEAEVYAIAPFLFIVFRTKQEDRSSRELAQHR
jgi:hypothetical protein